MKLQTSFLRSILFELQNFFRTYGYLFQLIFALLTFEEVRVLAGPFLMSKLCGMLKISNGFKIPFFPIENISQFIDEILKFEEMEYLIHHVKFEM